MIKSIKYFIYFFTTITFAQVGVGIGTDTPNSILDIESTSSGILIPRVVNHNTLTVSINQKGMQVYNTSTNSIWVFNGSIWIENASKSDGSKWQFNLTNIQLTTLSDGLTPRPQGKEIVITDEGRIGIGTSNPKTTLDVGGTAAMKVPVGTTAERPVSPEVGMIRYNGTTNTFEGYNGSVWVILN